MAIGDEFEGSVGRRGVIVGAAGGVGAIALSSCGSAADVARDEVPQRNPAEEAVVLAKLSDIPAGGAVSVSGPGGRQVIVAQPAAGTVKAFDAACTHKGCPVRVENTALECPCHGSSFEKATGAVLSGPANRPLAPVDVHLDQQGMVRTGA